MTSSPPLDSRRDQGTSDSRRTPHVLIVDDDPGLLQVLSRTLELRLDAVTVEVCTSARSALERIGAVDYDAIVSDIGMPGLDGLALLAAIRERSPDTPTLLITGQDDPRLAVRALRGGAYDFLQKPIDREDFVASLRRALQTRQLRRQVQAQQAALARHAQELEATVAARTTELQAANERQQAMLAREQAARAEAESAQQRVAFLAEASDLLNSSLDYGDTLTTLARLIVPSLADWCIVDVVEADQSLRRIAVTHVDPAKAELAAAVRERYTADPAGRDGIGWALRKQRTIVYPEVAEEQLVAAVPDPEYQRLLRALGTRSVMCLPLLVWHRVLGVITFAYGDSGRRYDAAARAVLVAAHELAQRAAVAVDNARLYREAQEAIARQNESLALLDTLMATAPVGMAFCDRELRFVRVNDALAAMNGVPATQHLGRRIDEVLPEPVATQVMRDYRRVLETGDPLRDREMAGETRAAPAALRHWLASYYPVRGSGGHPLGIGAVVVDITERKRAEQERARLLAEVATERDRLQQVLNVLPDAILLADRSGQIAMSNRTAVAITGEDLAGTRLPLAQADRQTTNLVLRLDGSPYRLADIPLIRSLLQGETVLGEQYLVRKPDSGEETPVLASSAPLRDARGRILGSVVAFKDITTIKDIERARDEFLSSASHDLKTPLTAVRGFAQLLQRRAMRAGTLEPGQVLDGLNNIVTATNRMATLLDELLDLARLQLRRPLELNRRVIDLVAIARRAVAEGEQLSKRHRFQFEAPIPSLYGAWDEPRLERVLANLIGNAVKYSAPGSEVRVAVTPDSTDPARPSAVLRVEDQGIGIPAADLPRIFERFHRAGNVVGRVAGSGIGLTGARQIVEQHGGTITVASQEGVGTTFTVRLPFLPETKEPAIAPR